MLMECDSWAQRVFFRTFEFGNRCSKQFGLVLVMGEIVRKANTVGDKHGISATVLSMQCSLL